MGSKEYWDLVTTAARDLVTVTNYNTDVWADELIEAVGRVWDSKGISDPQTYLDVLKHGKLHPTTETVCLFMHSQGLLQADWQETMRAAAWLTMLHDVETAAYKLAEARTESIVKGLEQE